MAKTPPEPAAAASPPATARVLLDLNNPQFQADLLGLPKAELLAARSTLEKLRQMTWQQVHADHGLKWEKVSSITPPAGIAAIYTLRLSQGRRATAYREADYLRLLSIPPDHDATYGRK